MIRQMADQFSDEEIALTLNRRRLRTGSGQSWTAGRVAYTRKNHNLPEFQAADPGEPALTLQQAAKRLQVSTSVIRRLIARGVISGRQIVDCAPWQIPAKALDSDSVKRALARLGQRRGGVRTMADDRQRQMFSET